MQDDPTPQEILTRVAHFLRQAAMPALRAPHLAFQARVAANAVDLVIRQLDLGAAGEAAEHDRLRTLIGRDDSLTSLNTALADGIAAGSIDPADPLVAAHLLATSREKIAVDQPHYAALPMKDD
ncbi:MAG: DUF6285 domain-containing protein [Sphingomonas bacterium]|nr:DUF6285 domain-containing protein [Sphingomonas bacterium]